MIIIGIPYHVKEGKQKDTYIKQQVIDNFIPTSLLILSHSVRIL